MIENIKKHMEESHITQKELGYRTGIAQATLSKMLNGKYSISHKYLLKIAQGLGVSIEELSTQTSSSNTTVEGYIEYNGDIIKIKTYNQFKKLADLIEYETKILPKEVKQIQEINKKNRTEINRVKANDNYNFDFDFKSKQEHDATKVDCWAFKTSSDTKDGFTLDLGNQCSGYPFDFFGKTFYTSESAYLCGQFSANSDEHTNIQNQLLAEKNGYAAKKRIKNPNANLIRTDWEEFNAEWMLLVIWHKCKGNKDFANKLKAIPANAVFIENSTTIREATSNLWGCKNNELEQARNLVERYTVLKYSKMAQKDKNLPSLNQMIQKARNEIQYIGTYKDGYNYMGKILKQCQIALLKGIEPNINYSLLNDKKIYLFGKLLEF